MNNDFSSLIKESIEEEERKRNKIEDENKTKISFNFNDIRNKMKNNFFAGFGIGLITCAVAMFIFQPVTKLDQAESKIKKASEMNNEEIIEKAKKLGMEFPNSK